MLPFLLLIAQKTPPPDLERTAALLRETGAKVEVAQEDGEWEIWADHSGPIKPGTLKPFSGVKALAVLRIFSDDLTDDHLAELKSVRNLKLLVIMSDKLTDKSTLPISKMAALTKLDLNKGVWTAKGLDRLKSLKNLRRLYLYNARIADQDLLALKPLTWLTLLDLPKSVTDQTLAELAQALPKVKVSRGI